VEQKHERDADGYASFASVQAENKIQTQVVAIAALEEWGGKKILIYPMGYPELMRMYGCKKGDISEFEAWAYLGWEVSDE
jgi:hypothetical protein